MLILTRRVGERIYIGDDIIVEVLGVNALGVRLGVTAPAALEIDREEVHKRKLRERSSAPSQSAFR